MPDKPKAPDAASTPRASTGAAENTSGQGRLHALPEGVAGWSWGAFILSWIWAIGNRTWLGLFGLVPGVGLVVRVLLGMNGRRWAWQNRRWDSVEHFRRVQRQWSVAALALLGLALIGIVAAIAIPMRQDSQARQALEAAVTHANRASQAVGRYAASHRAFPRSLPDAGFGEPPPSGVRQLAVDPENGELQVTMDIAALRGKRFHLQPTVEADGSVRWRCRHGDIPVRLLPKQCKDNPTGELEL